MSGSRKSPFEQVSPQSWKPEEATTPEEDAAYLKEKIEEFVTAAARFDKHKTEDERAAELKLKSMSLGLSVEELEERILAKKEERNTALASKDEETDQKGDI